MRTHFDLGDLARCIADSGAIFYGAHWCPVCREQNQVFGEHAASLPYFECYDGPRSAGMNSACTDAGVRGLPTWVFADGRVELGAMTPLALATASGCLNP